MDAICFVFGVSAKHLRGEKLKDLIWHVVGGDSAVKQPAPKTASVSVVYAPDEDEVGLVATRRVPDRVATPVAARAPQTTRSCGLTTIFLLNAPRAGRRGRDQRRR
jgi:hypothetical protein